MQPPVTPFAQALACFILGLQRKANTDRPSIHINHVATPSLPPATPPTPRWLTRAKKCASTMSMLYVGSTGFFYTTSSHHEPVGDVFGTFSRYALIDRGLASARLSVSTPKYHEEHEEPGAAHTCTSRDSNCAVAGQCGAEQRG